MRRVPPFAILFALLAIPGLARAAAEDDPLLVMFRVDQFEARDTDEATGNALEAQLWIGRDLNKFRIKSEIERGDEGTESAELQVLYSKAIDSNWDLQVGLRRDLDPKPERNWAVLGFSGVAPYWLEIDSALFVEEDGQVNLRLEAEYEVMLTQRWVLSPELEINWFSDDDDELGIAAGLAAAEAGLRLSYEFRRDLATYIGLHYETLLGETRDRARDADLDTSESALVAGLRFWF